jgi:hypothetical protein
MGLTLSPEKTRITALTKGCRFLGCRVRLNGTSGSGFMPASKSPRADQRLPHTGQSTGASADASAFAVGHASGTQSIPSGWSAYYRYCVGAKRIFASLDWHVRQRLWLWLRAKHSVFPGRQDRIGAQAEVAHPGNKVWAEGGTGQFLMSSASSPVRSNG